MAQPWRGDWRPDTRMLTVDTQNEIRFAPETMFSESEPSCLCWHGHAYQTQLLAFCSFLIGPRYWCVVVALEIAYRQLRYVQGTLERCTCTCCVTMWYIDHSLATCLRVWVTSLGSGSTSLHNSDLIIHLGLTSQPYTHTNPCSPHTRRASVI